MTKVDYETVVKYGAIFCRFTDSCDTLQYL